MDFILGFTDVCAPGPNCKVDLEVLVTIVSIIATVYLGIVAWRTSRESVHIAKEAKEISDRQLREITRNRQATAEIILHMVALEIIALPDVLYYALKKLDGAVRWGDRVVIAHGQRLEEALAEMGRQHLSAAHSNLERLHTLPEPVGGQLSRLIGMGMSLSTYANELLAPTRTADHPQRTLYIYQVPHALPHIREVLVLYAALALKLTQLVAEHTHQAPGDYRDVEKYIESGVPKPPAAASDSDTGDQPPG